MKSWHRRHFFRKQMLIAVTLLLSFDKTVGSFCGGSHLVSQMFGDDSNRKWTDLCSFSSMEVKDGFCLLEEKHFIAFEQVRGPLSRMSGEDLESQIKKTGKVG